MFLFTIWHLNSSPSFLCPRMRRRFSAVFRHGEWEKPYTVTVLYPSTFADPHFRKEDSVFVTHECSPAGLIVEIFIRNPNMHVI